MVEGGMKCIKYLLFLFNLLFVIAGIGLIASGAYVQIKLDDYRDFFGNEYSGPGILLIVVGVIIFMVAFFGCWGAIRENYCMVMTFAVSLAIIFIMVIAGGIAGFVLRDDIEGDIEKYLTDAIPKYNGPGEGGITKAWDKLQEEFDCCGVTNVTDWDNNQHLNGTLPHSCCLEATSGCSTADPSSYYPKACKQAFEDWVKDKVAILGGVGVGLAFVQVVGIIFACCLARAIRKEYEVV